MLHKACTQFCIFFMWLFCHFVGTHLTHLPISFWVVSLILVTVLIACSESSLGDNTHNNENNVKCCRVYEFLIYCIFHLVWFHFISLLKNLFCGMTYVHRFITIYALDFLSSFSHSYFAYTRFHQPYIGLAKLHVFNYTRVYKDRKGL